ncbi:hypothetical protein UFOVP1670_67 [uncultured Caudovirales phage]|uniref:Uncharacterized protein n=1 Tax=uncultured Caudovirales phage TaxID=2100421 RepID=A0A6J5T764_9CAUD|nr:hypothetical protein UFOVP1670_67 [uncultured Caudovirales phage]
MGQHKTNQNAILASAGKLAPAATKLEDFRTQYGHNGTHVLMIFPRPIENLMLTSEQVHDTIKALQEVRHELIMHQQRAGAALKS